MNESFIPVKDSAALEQLFQRSRNEAVLLFKHDPFCPISAAAHRQLEQLQQPVPTIDVANDQELSQLVAERTGVAHASPQALLLRHGDVVWSESLRAITAEAVTQAQQLHG